MNPSRTRRLWVVGCAALLLIAAAACGGSYPAADGETPCSPRTTGTDPSWTGERPVTCPPPTTGGLMAPMVVNGKPVVILFGGTVPGPDGDITNPSDYTNETWMWDGASWSHLHPSQSPPPLQGAAMAYDANHNRIVLFGGFVEAVTKTARTYTFDGSTWTDRSDDTDLRTFAHTPTPRVNVMMATDNADGGVVLFGGLLDSGNQPAPRYADDTWLWDGSSWIQKQVDSNNHVDCNSTSRPCGRESGAMAPDPATGGVVLFGGNGDPRSLADTWVFQGNSWTRKAPAHNPGGRGMAGFAALDARTDILFGGDVSGTGDNSWTWNGTDWTPVQQSPIARASAQIATLGPDGARPSQAVVFGGRALGTHSLDGHDVYDVYDDTWSYHTATTPPPPPPPAGPWLQLQAQGPASTSQPSGRHAAAMAMFRSQSNHHNALLFGGEPTSGSSPLGDTWMWNGTAWSQILPSGLPEPPARSDASMTWDGVTNTVVLFGGIDAGGNQLSDTWVWNPQTLLWSEVTCATRGCSPSPREGAAMATDFRNNGVLLFGGQQGSNTLQDTWTWDGVAEAWTEQPVGGPGSRSLAVAGLNEADGGVVMFGGLDLTGGGFSVLGDTWTWDGSAWTQFSSSPAPSGRFGASMASLDLATVLFGGTPASGTGTLNDTWSWDGTGWTQITTPSAPPGRVHAAAAASETSASDPTLNMLLFGGSPASVDNDTWRYTP